MSLEAQTAGRHRFQHSIISPYAQPIYKPSFMKRPSRWSTSPTTQTAQGRETLRAGEGQDQEGRGVSSARPHYYQELH